MIETWATYGAWIFAAWLSLVGAVMLITPQAALVMLRKAGSSVPINVAELGLRLLFGLSLIGLSAATSWPKTVLYVGIFLAATSVLILMVPLSWHNGYAVWWADRLPPVLVRLLAPLSFAAAAFLVFAVIP